VRASAFSCESNEAYFLYAKLETFITRRGYACFRWKQY
jgi:hypothetical protein